MTTDKNTGNSPEFSRQLGTLLAMRAAAATNHVRTGRTGDLFCWRRQLTAAERSVGPATSLLLLEVPTSSCCSFFFWHMMAVAQQVCSSLDASAPCHSSCMFGASDRLQQFLCVDCKPFIGLMGAHGCSSRSGRSRFTLLIVEMQEFKQQWIPADERLPAMLHHTEHWRVGSGYRRNSHPNGFTYGRFHNDAAYPQPVAMLLKSDGTPCTAVRLTTQQAHLAAWQTSIRPRVPESHPMCDTCAACLTPDPFD
jgi:hypothetical protein